MFTVKGVLKNEKLVELVDAQAVLSTTGNSACSRKSVSADASTAFMYCNQLVQFVVTIRVTLILN